MVKVALISFSLFTFQISDDDRMSLTTAISDEDDAESNPNSSSPYKAAGSMTKAHQMGGGGGSAASFNCTGAVRKAGFLSVKKWLLRKKHQVRRVVLVKFSQKCQF